MTQVQITSAAPWIVSIVELDDEGRHFSRVDVTEYADLKAARVHARRIRRALVPLERGAQ